MQDPAAVVGHMSPSFDATFRAVTSSSGELRYDEQKGRCEVDQIPVSVEP